MGAAPPWGQSLLRSCLASHSFPPHPPRTCCPHSEHCSRRHGPGETLPLVHGSHRSVQPRDIRSLDRNISEAAKSEAAEPPTSGGGGRQGGPSQRRSHPAPTPPPT